MVQNIFFFQLGPKESQVRNRETMVESIYVLHVQKCIYKNKKEGTVQGEGFTVWSFYPLSAIKCSRLCVSGIVPGVSCPFHCVVEHSC